MDAGHIHLRLTLEGARIRKVAIVVQRPDIARALRGKPADWAVQQLPLIYALCGKAQGQAAVLALAAACGVDTAPHLHPAIEAEALREHAWRILLDLPPLLGLPAQTALFAGVRCCLEAGDRSGLQALLADPFWNQWMLALEQLPAVPDVESVLLPVMGAVQSLSCWPRLTAEFACAPLWNDEPAETGAYARWNGQNPSGAEALAARWQARCAELWSWAAGDAKVGAGGTASAASAGPRTGRALVDTARGLLMHEVTVDADGHIDDYVIVAPTEWNFHLRGALHDWLFDRAVDDRERLRGEVGHMVAALDPCVGWSLELVN